MKLDITEEDFKTKMRSIARRSLISPHEQEAITTLKKLGVTFKQEIDWEAETHDPSVIPDKWLIECWDDGDTHRRSTYFFHGKGNRTYTEMGSKHGLSWNNYRAIKKEDWPKWAIEAHKSLED